LQLTRGIDMLDVDIPPPDLNVSLIVSPSVIVAVPWMVGRSPARAAPQSSVSAVMTVKARMPACFHSRAHLATCSVNVALPWRA
jgi:hypothetical protein